MTRREERIKAMQIIYTSDFNKITFDDASKIIDDINFHGLDFVKLVSDNLEKIDSIISESLVNYTMERLNLVDKAIIRLATAELLSGTDKKIVINEALEITKEYSDQGDHKAVSFNNKLLDNICKKLM